MKFKQFLAFLVGLVLAGPALAIDITTCGQVLSVVSGNYVLVSNLTCDGAGIRVTANNVTVDLNGKELKYNNLVSGGLNPGFEFGTGTTADNWDVSGCNGHCFRRSNSDFAAIQNWRMNFEGAAVGDSLSTLISLPATTLCQVAWMIEDRFSYWYSNTSPGPQFRIKVYSPAGVAMLHDTDGSVGKRWNDNGCPGPDTGCVSGQCKPSQGTCAAAVPALGTVSSNFTSTTAGNYKLTLVWESVPTGPNAFDVPLYVDQLDIRVTQQFGINIQSGSGVIIKNGTVTQGAGQGTFCHAINGVRDGGTVGLPGAGVTINTNGVVSLAISGGGSLSTGNNITIQNNTINVTNPTRSVYNRTALENAVFIVGPVTPPGPTGLQIKDNVITSTQGGITVSHYLNSTISGNTITNSAQVTNHYGINVFESPGITTTFNTITSDHSQGGIDYSGSGTLNNSVISSNTVNLVGVSPIGDFGGYQDHDGIRINTYGHTSDNIQVSSNILNLSGGEDPFYSGPLYTTDCDPVPPPQDCDGKSMWGIINHSGGSNVTFTSNVVNINLTDPKVVAFCYALGSTANTYTTSWADNECHSNRRAIAFGGYPTTCNNHAVRRMQIEKLTPVGTWLTLQGWRTQQKVNQVRLIDTILSGGATLGLSDSYIVPTMQCYDYTIEWPLSVHIANAQGVFLGPEQAVSIKNLAGTVVASGNTLNGIYSAELIQEKRCGVCNNASTPVPGVCSYSVVGGCSPCSVPRYDTQTPHAVTVGTIPSLPVTMDRNRTIEMIVGSATFPTPANPPDSLITRVNGPGAATTGTPFSVDLRLKKIGAVEAFKFFRNEITYDSTLVVPLYYEPVPTLATGLTEFPTSTAQDISSGSDGARALCGGKSVKWIQGASLTPFDPAGVTIGRMWFRPIAAGATSISPSCSTPDATAVTTNTLLYAATGQRAIIGNQFGGAYGPGANWVIIPTNTITITGPDFDPATAWPDHPGFSEYVMNMGTGGATPSLPAVIPVSFWGDQLQGGSVSFEFPQALTFAGVSGVRSGWTAVAGATTTATACATSKVVTVTFSKTSGIVEDLTGTTIFNIGFTSGGVEGTFAINMPCSYVATEKSSILVGPTKQGAMRLTWLSPSADPRWQQSFNGEVRFSVF